VTTWFEISDIGKMSKVAMNKILVRSSGRTIMGVIKSSAVVFYVSYPGGMAPRLQRSDVKASGGATRSGAVDPTTSWSPICPTTRATQISSDLGIDGIY